MTVEKHPALMRYFILAGIIIINTDKILWIDDDFRRATLGNQVV